MSDYITDDTCEDVTICAPNDPDLYCTPDGVLSKTQLSPVFSHWQYLLNGPVYEDDEMVKPQGFAGAFDVDLYINDAKYGQYYMFSADGTDYDDIISGFDLLSGVDVGLQDTSAYPASTFSGNAAFFSISGGKGNDILIGAMNADVLNGGHGNDSIGGAGGSDSITGGNGHDTIWADGIIGLNNPLYIHDPWRSGPYDNIGSANDLVDGGDGNDTVYGGGGDDGIIGGLGYDHLYGGDGNDDLDGGANDDCLDGGKGNDWMSGGTGNDDIYGGDGNDCADGGDGNDNMWLGAGDDRALGGAGDDHMYGGTGNDKLDGGAGDDCVAGEAGNDLVDGGAGDDEVYGGDGNDIVRGGLGEDVVWGGAGCDIFAFCDVEFNCSDEIADFSAGRDPDQIDLSNLDDLDSIRVEETGFTNLVRLDLIVDGQAVQQILVAGEEAANLQSVFEKDTAYGTDQGALVKVGAGVMVDLPSTSVIFSDGDGLFY